MHALKVASLLALVVLEVGCGLPSPYFLSPPSVSALFSALTNSCTIQNSGRSGDYQATFQGFELYYKFFGQNTDSTFLADQQYATTSYSPPDLINSHGFRRVTLGRGTNSVLTPDSTPGNASAPLINIAKLDPTDILNTFSITITFNDATASVAAAIGDPAPVSYYHFGPTTGATGTSTEIYYELRRFLAINPNQTFASGCEFFTNNGSTGYSGTYAPTGGDPDVGAAVYTSSQAANPSGSLLVMIYAAAYGLAGSQVVYSTPVYLGYTQIPAFP